MDFNERTEGLFEEYQRQRNSLTELLQKMREISVTVTSPRREVTVTVGQTGFVTDIKFPTSAYKRLAPADLAAIIMETLAEAKEQAAEEAAAVLTPVLPEGVDAHALVRGTAGTDAFLPPEPRMATSVREILGMARPAK